MALRAVGAILLGLGAVGFGQAAEGDCPVCVDCTPVESELGTLKKVHAEVEQAKAKLEREISAVLETSTVHERNVKALQSGEQNLIATIESLKKEKQEIAASREKTVEALKVADSAKCDCTAAERDALAASRQKLAQDNEELKRTFVQLESSNKGLEERAQVLSQKAEQLASMDAERKMYLEEAQALRSKVAKEEAERIAAESSVSESREQISKLLSSVEDISSKYNDLYNKNKNYDYLFSTQQFTALCRRMYTFSKGVVLLALQRQRELVETHAPPAVKEVGAQYWAAVSKSVSDLKTSLHMKVAGLYRAHVQSYVNKVTSVVSELYRKRAQPLVSRQASVVAAQLKVASVRASEAALTANRYTDHYFVDPLIDLCPEMEALIPAGVSDRVCLLLFLILFELIALRILRRLVPVVKCAISCSFRVLCWPCRRGRKNRKNTDKKSLKAAERKNKSFKAAAAAPAERKNKSFKAAAATPSAPVSQRAAAAGATIVSSS